MYRPNFCADCGERIYRKRWMPWTNRRFCPKCSTRLRRATVFVPLFFVLALVTAAWLAGRAVSPEPPPLIIERAALATAMLTAPSDAQPSADTPRTESTAVAPATSARASYAGQIDDPSQPVFICGARTKKGTPCSRRVSSAGRCWQHRGRAAMLSPGKLVVR